MRYRYSYNALMEEKLGAIQTSCTCFNPYSKALRSEKYNLKGRVQRPHDEEDELIRGRLAPP